MTFLRCAPSPPGAERLTEPTFLVSLVSPVRKQQPIVMGCHVPEGMLGTPRRMPSTSFYPLSVDLAYLCTSLNRMQAKGRWLAYFWSSCFFLEQRFNVKVFLGI